MINKHSPPYAFFQRTFWRDRGFLCSWKNFLVYGVTLGVLALVWMFFYLWYNAQFESVKSDYIYDRYKEGELIAERIQNAVAHHANTSLNDLAVYLADTGSVLEHIPSGKRVMSPNKPIARADQTVFFYTYTIHNASETWLLSMSRDIDDMHQHPMMQLTQKLYFYGLFSLTLLSLLACVAVYIGMQRKNERHLYQKQLEDALNRLKISEERYTLAAQGTQDGLWDYDLRDNTIYFSDRWKAILGFAPDAIQNDPIEWFSRIINEDREEFFTMFDHAQHVTGSDNHFQYEYRMLGEQDKVYFVETRWVTVCDHNDQPFRMVGFMTDITRRKNIEKKLEYDALHDILTGLPNRALFNNRLEKAVLQFKRYPEHKFVVLLLDLDSFKKINDTLGHGAGDYFLATVGQRLVSAVRETDTVARLGGDEFAILMEPFDDEDALKIMLERLLETISEPLIVEDTCTHPKISIGATIMESHYIDRGMDALLHDADTALYAAKHKGKGTYVIFNTDEASA